MSELIIVLGLVLLGGVFAGAEIAVVAVRKTRLEELAGGGSGSARTLLALREQPERFLATVQIGITVVSATAAAFGGASIARHLVPHLERLGWFGERAPDVALALVVSGVSFLSIVLGELVPKSLALRGAEFYALRIARPLYGLAWLARPLVWLLSQSANLILKPFGDRTTFTEARHSPEEVQQIVDEGVRAGTIHPDAGEIVSRALEMPELRVRDVMVPQPALVMLRKNAPPEDLRRVLLEHAHSRFPVYEDRIDNVVGYVSSRDVLALLLSGRQLDLAAILRPPYFVPESKRAVELLEEMRSLRVPFAIVVDEQGAIAGIVTLEDLVEEVVGDIFSEHVKNVPQLIQREPTGTALLSGAAPVREVNRTLDVELPEDGDWTTVAGLCLALAGRMPVSGEKLPVPGGMTLEILDASPRRVRVVRLHFAEPGLQGTDAGETAA